MNGETEIQNDNRKFRLYFIINDKKNNNNNKKIKIEDCTNNDFFFDVVDKLCQTETTIDKDKLKTDEFTINGRTGGKEYIDYNDTLEGNNLKGNEEIIVMFKNEDNEE